MNTDDGDSMSDGGLPRRVPVDTDLTTMSDPEFLAWCTRIRMAKESVPDCDVPDEITAEFSKVNREYMRRAGTGLRDT